MELETGTGTGIGLVVGMSVGSGMDVGGVYVLWAKIGAGTGMAVTKETELAEE